MLSRTRAQFLVRSPAASSHVRRPHSAPSPQGYYRSAHALARIARQMSRQLWRPATESDGVPVEVLTAFMGSLNEWRDEHLQHVGVPSNFEAEWDFVSAVTACTSPLPFSSVFSRPLFTPAWEKGKGLGASALWLAGKR